MLSFSNLNLGIASWCQMECIEEASFLSAATSEEENKFLPAAPSIPLDECLLSADTSSFVDASASSTSSGLQVIIPHPSKSLNCDSLNTQPKKRARGELVVSHYNCMHLVSKLYIRRKASVLPRILLKG